MTTLTRRSLLRNSVGLAAVGVLPCPYTANAAATTVVTWWNQGYLPEEDVSFRALVANYQKASGDKRDFCTATTHLLQAGCSPTPSIMPAALNAWPHAPAIMIGEKAAPASPLDAKMVVARQAPRRNGSFRNNGVGTWV